MLRSLLNSLLWGALASLLATACSTTAPQIKSVWKDPAYKAHPHRIMVIGMAREPLQRRIFEDEFVAQLRELGADAVASYTVLSDAKMDDRAAVAKMVTEQVPDTVLLTRLVSRKSVKTYMPGTVYYRPAYYGKWRDYYHHGYDAIVTPGYVARFEYALMETNLYDARTEKLIWAAAYEAEITSPDLKRIKPYITLMVNNMVEQGLFRK